jgi:glycosyltransferase involved in cell wall biosynthesis
MSKTKVVWLCHFSNALVQSKLKVRRNISEFAPWIAASIKQLEFSENIELHIISPHEYISGVRKFNINNVNYYFYNPFIPIWGRHWPDIFRFDYWSNFYFSKRITKRLVDKIQPDIIHLHGAENAYYSSTVFQFIERYPVILTIQGFISKTLEQGSKIIGKRIQVENEIIEKIPNAVVRTQSMADELQKRCPQVEQFHLHYPMLIPEPQKLQKKYDLVFFARITKDKGIFDYIKAISKLKRQKQNIRACVIGSGRMEDFMAIANADGLEENIDWIGFLPSQREVHDVVSQSKICVLPTYHDIISGTIVESLLLGIPVVAYDVGSIHEVNAEEEIVQLAPKGNIKDLVERIRKLLNDAKLYAQLSQKSRQRALSMFGDVNTIFATGLSAIYQSMLKK